MYSLGVLFNDTLCNRIISRTCRRFNEKYPNLPHMNPRKFQRIKSNLCISGKQQPNRECVITDNNTNVIHVLAYFHANPHSSIRAAKDELGLSYYALQKILKKNKMHPFSLRSIQELYPNDAVLRRQFCENFLIKLT